MKQLICMRIVDDAFLVVKHYIKSKYRAIYRCTLQIAEVDSNGFMKDTYFVFQRVRTVSESALKLNRNVLRSKSF